MICSKSLKNYPGLLRGRGEHVIAGRTLYLDVPTGVVLYHGCRPVGLVGFTRSFWGDTLKVYQLQGIKGIKFFAQVSFDEWLITATESIARQLLCTRVAIRSAICNDYFEAENLSWQEATRRRQALIRRYNEVPESMGYRLRGRWRVKKIGAK